MKTFCRVVVGAALMVFGGALWNGFVELDSSHPADNEEMSRDIHDIQHRIMARAVRRSDKTRFRTRQLAASER